MSEAEDDVIDNFAADTPSPEPELDTTDDLALIVTRIEDLPSAPDGLRTDQLTPLAHSHGRLAELAGWWASATDSLTRELGDPAQPMRHHIRCHGVLDATHDPSLQGPEAAASVAEAWEWGVATSNHLIDAGTELLVVSVDAHDAAQVVSAELLGLDPMDLIGWPIETDATLGIDDESWMDDVLALRDGLHRTRGLGENAMGLLRATEDARFAAAVAVIANSTARRTPVLIDGVDAAAAALLIHREALAANQWWQIAQLTPSRLGERISEAVRRVPLLDLGIRVQDGTGAQLALPILNAAAELAHAHTRPTDSHDHPVEVTSEDVLDDDRDDDDS